MKMKDMVMSSMYQNSVAELKSGEELWKRIQSLLIKQVAWYVFTGQAKDIRAITLSIKKDETNNKIIVGKVLEFDDADYEKIVGTWYVGDEGIEFLNNHTHEMEDWARSEGLSFHDSTETETFYFCMTLKGQYEL